MDRRSVPGRGAAVLAWLLVSGLVVSGCAADGSGKSPDAAPPAHAAATAPAPAAPADPAAPAAPVPTAETAAPASEPAQPAEPPPAGSLPGTALTVRSIGGQPVPPGITVTLRFEDGRIGGKAGCNSYGAPVRAGLGSLMVGPVMSTKMACGPEEMAVETRFLEILAGIDRFQSDPAGDLVLEGPAGRIVAGP